MPRRTDTIWFIGDDRFIELMHALTYPEERWTYPVRPNILEALDELIAWTKDSRDYDARFHESAWQSAIKDFRMATDTLGSKIKQVVQSDLDTIQSSCQPNVGGDRELRSQLSADAATLRQTLGSIPALTAAWSDLTGAINRKESPVNTISLRRDNFWAIVRAADRNTVELSQRLTSVLSGDPFEELNAKLLLGEIDKIDRSRNEILRDAPMAHPQQRLELAVKLLSAEPANRVHKVWFAFRHAGLTRVTQDFSSIQVFEAQWLRANLLHGEPFQDKVPSELRGLEGAESIPDQQDVVIASVDLGEGTFSDAVRVASERLEAFVGMSMIGAPVPWERIPGFIHAQDGRIVANQFFSYEDERFGPPPQAFDYAAAQITNTAPRVAQRLPITDHSMRDIIDALQWWRTGPGQPSAASVILNVRVIELIASRAGETDWTTYLEKYFKNPWVQAAIMQVFHTALHEAITRRVAQEAQPVQRALFLDVMEYEGGQQRFNIQKAARHLDAIIEFTPPNLPLGRDLRTIRKRTSSAHEINKWCAELETQWGGSVHRLERLRNAIAHGGAFTERMVILTQPFSQTLAVWALLESTEGYLDGKVLTQTHEDYKNHWDQWRSSARSATSIDDLFERESRPET